MTEKYSNIRLSSSRIKPVGQGKGRAVQEWTNLTKAHHRKKKNGRCYGQFIVDMSCSHYSRGYLKLAKVENIHNVIETVDGKQVDVVYGRVGKVKVRKSGVAEGMGKDGITVGRWVVV